MAIHLFIPDDILKGWQQIHVLFLASSLQNAQTNRNLLHFNGSVIGFSPPPCNYAKTHSDMNIYLIQSCKFYIFQ